MAKKAAAAAATGAGGGRSGVAAGDVQHIQLTQLQSLHINTDRFLGSRDPQHVQVRAPDAAGHVHLVSADIAPALLTTWKEMLDNLIDQVRIDSLLTTIRFGYHDGTFLVENDGSGMQVVKVHQPGASSHGMWKPQACASVFDFTSKTEIAASSSAEGSSGDEGSRTTGLAGKNGVGMKGVNGTSSSFELYTEDVETRKTLTVRWSDCMRKLEYVKDRKKAGKWDRGVTRFTWRPDLAFFGMRELTPEAICILRNMVWRRGVVLANLLQGGEEDIAVTDKSSKNKRGARTVRLQWSETLNEAGKPQWKNVPWTSMSSMMAAYAASTQEAPDEDGGAAVVGKKKSPSSSAISYTVGTVSICVVPVPGVSVGYVNGMQCDEGEHLQAAWQIVRDALETAWKKRRRGNATVPEYTPKFTAPARLAKVLSVGMSVRVKAPVYDAQSKSTLKSKARTFMPKTGITLPPGATNTLADLVLPSVFEAAASEMQRASIKMAKAQTSSTRAASGGRRIVNVPNYTTAGWADVRGKHCALFISEGYSSRNYPMTLRGAMTNGIQRIGIFSVQGKVLNVVQAGTSKAQANKELQSLACILGLKFGQRDADPATMRYQELWIGTDMDTDGNNIFAQIYVAIATLWPGLLRRHPSFIKRYVTPLLRVVHRATSASVPDAPALHSIAQAQQWLMTLTPGTRAHIVLVHVKGLGQWPRADIIAHARSVDANVVTITHTGEETERLLRLAFERDAEPRRRVMLEEFDETAFLDYDVPAIPFPQWMQVELLAFFWDSVQRSIPKMQDGMCPVERRTIWCMIHNNYRQAARTATVSSRIVEATKYSHGEESLQKSIARLACLTVGKSNFNILADDGSFGTRANKQPAKPRYTYTRLTSLTSALFPRAFMRVVPRTMEDGCVVQAQEMPCPIPYIFLNGRSAGIGTGWSTEILPYHHTLLFAAVKDMLRTSSDASMQPRNLASWRAALDTALPHFDGYLGAAQRVCGASEKAAVEFRGRLTVDEAAGRIAILDLPPGKWIDEYAGNLEKFMRGEPRHKLPVNCPPIQSVENFSTDELVHIVLHVDRAALPPLMEKTEDMLPLPSLESSSLPAGLLDAARFGGPAASRKTYPDLEKALGIVKLSSLANMNFMNGETRTVLHYERNSDYMLDWAKNMAHWYTVRLAAERDDAHRAVVKLENRIRYVCETRMRAPGEKVRGGPDTYPAEVFALPVRKDFARTALPPLATLRSMPALAGALTAARYASDTDVTPVPTPVVRDKLGELTAVPDEDGLASGSVDGAAAAALGSKKKSKKRGRGGDELGDDEEDACGAFKYLLSMTITTQTDARLQRLIRDLQAARAHAATLDSATIQTLWGEDLRILEEEMARFHAARRDVLEKTSRSLLEEDEGHGAASADGTRRRKKETGGGRVGGQKRSRDKSVGKQQQGTSKKARQDQEHPPRPPQTAAPKSTSGARSAMMAALFGRE